MSEIRTMQDVDRVLRQFIPTAKTAVKDYSRENIKQLLDHVGNPEARLRVIHVAGTSGKTSTSYYIAAMLQSAGKTVGLTVSPHIDSVAERVQINGRPLPEKTFCKYFQEFLQLVETSGAGISYFECMVGFALWVFDKEQVDFAVVEVGMGGRHDATNVFSQHDKICVITDIGLDHTEVLGNTLDKIAYEKGGIIQSQNRVLMYEQQPEVMAVIDNIVADKKANLELVAAKPAEAPEHLPLFQKRNWTLARQVAEAALDRQLTPAETAAAANTTVPARMEILQYKGKTLILDGAHNGQKMQALVRSLASRFAGQEIAVLAAFVQSNNTRAFDAVDELLPIASELVITAFSGEQDTPKVSINPDIISDHVKTKGYGKVQVIKDPAKAFHQVIGSEAPVVLVTGSFYLMNHVRPLIKGLQT